jgi:polysaccharide pyruvyl transferase CsaB
MKISEKNKKKEKEKKKKGSRKKADSNLHPRVVISGYYGFDNLGDELILRVLVDELKAHKVNITVLSQNPKKTAAEYGVEAIKRTSFIDIVDAFTKANLFISGGGGLFQDVTGPLSAVYYGGLIHLARFFEVPVCFWAQGVGPLNRKFSRNMTASALKKCEVITVRDEKSAQLVESLIRHRPEITADPVWLLNARKKKMDLQKKQKYVKPSGPWRVGISLRSWPELTEEGLHSLARCLHAMASKSGRSVEYWLLPFQKAEDQQLLETLAGFLRAAPDAKAILVPPDDVLKRIEECDVLFGMRFHSLILGLLSQVPVYGLIYDPKVATLLEMFGLPGIPVAELKNIDAVEVQTALANYPTVDLKPFKQKSRRNFQILNRLLEIPEAELVL